MQHRLNVYGCIHPLWQGPCPTEHISETLEDVEVELCSHYEDSYESNGAADEAQYGFEINKEPMRTSSFQAWVPLSHSWMLSTHVRDTRWQANLSEILKLCLMLEWNLRCLTFVSIAINCMCAWIYFISICYSTMLPFDRPRATTDARSGKPAHLKTLRSLFFTGHLLSNLYSSHMCLTKLRSNKPTLMWPAGPPRSSEPRI